MTGATPPSAKGRTSGRRAPGRSQGSVFARGLAVLGAMTELGEARADELAAMLDMPVSTVYRYLRQLREQGFVVDEAGVYRCGPVLAAGGAAARAHGRLVETAAPLMQRLTGLTGETTTLAGRVGISHVLCIHQTESPRAERIAFRIGQTLPLHAGAGERVLLAFAPDDVIQMILSGDLERFTPNTPDCDELERKIASTRRSWITTSRAEYIPGALALAVPVAVNDQVLCSLTVSGPQARCDAAWQRSVRPILLNAGKALEHLLTEAPRGGDELLAHT